LTTSDLGRTAHRVRLPLSGEIDAPAPDAFAHIVDARRAPGDRVVLHLSDVAFIGSTGMSMLLKARSYFAWMGSRRAVANPSASVARVLATLDVAERFSFEAGCRDWAGS
jgi:anti-anti-sigma factor